MRVLVVYDSVFGNTEKIARAIAEAVGAKDVLRAAEAGPERLAGLDLLIVGSPTRAFRPTKAVKGFLSTLPRASLGGVATAAFDTRMDPEEVGSAVLRVFVRIFGYAAGTIAAGLARKGGRPVAQPEGFIVTGTEGPLRQGELERAASWAKGPAASR